MTSAVIDDVLSVVVDIVTTDPLTALLFVVGNVLLFGSIGLFGALSAWGILSAFRPP